MGSENCDRFEISARLSAEKMEAAAPRRRLVVIDVSECASAVADSAKMSILR